MLRFYPFIPSSLFNLDFYAQQLEIVTGIGYVRWQFLFQCTHLIFLVLLVLFFFKKIRKDKAIVTNTSESFIYLFALICLGILLLLSYLSLTISRFYAPPNDLIWTYISDSRYHIFPLIGFPIVISVWLFSSAHKTGLMHVLQFLFVIILLLEVLHGIYFTIKVSQDLRPSMPDMVAQKQIEGFLEDQIRTNKENNVDVVVASNFSTFAQLANFHNGTGLFDTKVLNEDRIATSRPVKLLLITQEHYFKHFDKFLKKKGIMLNRKFYNYYCFSYDVYPAL